MSDSPVANYLSPEERELVLFIEQFHSVAGIAPDKPAMLDYMKSLGINISNADLDNYLKNPLFVKSMDARGIILDDDYRVNKKLTPRQMAAAAKMMDLMDRRSDSKKLADMGITSAEWQSWMQDNKFAAYMAGRAEKLISNSMHDAHLGLIKGVRQGNVPAIKLYYEMTDRYNPDKETAVNIQLFLGRLLEALQKHIKDPQILNSIGLELRQIAYEAMPQKSIKGEIS